MLVNCGLSNGTNKGLKVSIVVTQLNIYPVKSIAGISQAQSELTKTGLLNDRQFMLVNQAGEFITGREYPLLTQVSSTIVHDGIELKATGMPLLKVPCSQRDLASMTVKVWRDNVRATLVGVEYDAWFSRYLMVECHLVRLPEETARSADANFAGEGQYVSFADGYPILLISQASLDDLNSRLEQPVSMARFRPNIVVSGCGAYAEDGWGDFSVGGVSLKGVKNCSRCIFTTVDPETGVKNIDVEPLKTLSGYRRRREGGGISRAECDP